MFRQREAFFVGVCAAMALSMTGPTAAPVSASPSTSESHILTSLTPQRSLGKPDLVLAMDVAYTHGSHVDQTYRNFILALPIKHDVWIRAVDFSPSRPHDILFAALFVDETGAARKLQAHSGAIGYSAFEAGLTDGAVRLAEWAPGFPPQVFPVGIGQRVRAGSDLVLLLHFRQADPPVAEQSRIGLYFCREVPPRQARQIHFGLARLFMVAGQKATVTDSFVLPVACDVLRVMPHGHVTVRSMHLNAYLPDGKMRAIVEFDDWIAQRQTPLALSPPIRLSAGTRLQFRCNADDSEDNPRNPLRPPDDVIPTFSDMDAMADLDIVVAPAAQTDNDRLDSAIASRPSTFALHKTYVPDLQ